MKYVLCVLTVIVEFFAYALIGGCSWLEVWGRPYPYDAFLCCSWCNMQGNPQLFQ